MDSGFFPAFRLKLKHGLFLSLEPNELQTRTTPSALLVLGLLDLDQSYGVGSRGPPACQLTVQIWGLATSMICEPVPYYKSIYLFIYLPTHLIDSLSPENSD